VSFAHIVLVKWSISLSRIRRDIQQDAARLIQYDLRKLQISQRSAAKHIGISHSTLNAFLNSEYTRPNTKTIETLLDSPVWSEATANELRLLRDYERNVFFAASSETGRAVTTSLID